MATVEFTDVVQMMRKLGYRFHATLTEVSDAVFFYKDGKDFIFDNWDEAMDFALEQSEV